MSEFQALNATIYDLATMNKQSVLYRVCKYGTAFSAIFKIYSAYNSTDSGKFIYVTVILSDAYIFAKKTFTYGNSNITLYKDNNYFYVYVTGGTWSRTYAEIVNPSEKIDYFLFEDVTNSVDKNTLTLVQMS